MKLTGNKECMCNHGDGGKLVADDKKYGIVEFSAFWTTMGVCG